MISFSLNSGSNGNCIYVQTQGVRLLFDAGISGKRTAERLAAHGRDVRDVDAVIISHDHADHVRCAGILHRKFHLPIYMTRATFAAAKRYKLGPISDLRHFAVGQDLTFGAVTVRTVATPHDAADSMAFVISDGYRRLGILTDLGHVFHGLRPLLKRLDAVYMESNYDPDMLATGPYPTFLKRRIAGPAGHVSNVEAAELIAAADGRMQWVALSHLSEANNDPALAVRTHRAIAGRRRPVHVAGRHGVGELLKIE
ncbi:MAG: MBL fold metallo-hydrolase [Planctomycetota bacterium]|jgi:phosphoribosyl 1,2-cyclic phosphodiesterase